MSEMKLEIGTKVRVVALPQGPGAEDSIPLRFLQSLGVVVFTAKNYKGVPIFGVRVDDPTSQTGKAVLALFAEQVVVCEN